MIPNEKLLERNFEAAIVMKKMCKLHGPFLLVCNNLELLHTPEQRMALRCSTVCTKPRGAHLATTYSLDAYR